MFRYSVSFAKHAASALLHGVVGAAIVLIIVYIVYLNSREDLKVWHLADLDQEFTAESDIKTFAEYLRLEADLFKQLDKLVYNKIQTEDKDPINRYDRDSRSYPGRWIQNWNRTFELATEKPKAGVLLLHGMSDSPYSLRTIGESLNQSGAWVVGLRLPGHGTAPSGLVTLKWQDMAASVRLAMKHLQEKVIDRPIYIVGYSNGGALAVEYALSALDDPALPWVEKLVLISPAIGVTKVAALAVWQGRVGHLLGLDKLAWTDILPEYDPFKYNSFAVNAGDIVYRLTGEIQSKIAAHSGEELKNLPQILAFQSIVDATVSTPDLVKGLFQKLPAKGHELVLFDINRQFIQVQLLKQDPRPQIKQIMNRQQLAFDISFVTNEDNKRSNIIVTKRKANDGDSIKSTDLHWPRGIYSLTHVALPFRFTDPLYGGQPDEKSPAIQLGNIAMRGERGVLKISASEMLRLRWNPFFGYMQNRIHRFTGLEAKNMAKRKRWHNRPAM